MYTGLKITLFHVKLQLKQMRIPVYGGYRRDSKKQIPSIEDDSYQVAYSNKVKAEVLALHFHQRNEMDQTQNTKSYNYYNYF